MGLIEIEEDEMYPLTDEAAAEICSIVKSNIPYTPRTWFTKEDIARHCNLHVPDQFKNQYLDLLFKYQEAISIDKYDLGLAKNYKHKLYLKNNDPVYRKQFKIPEAHHNFMEQTLEELLKLGVQLTNFLRAQETNPRTQNRARLSGTQPELPHQQILNERNHRMHQWHRTIKLQHLFNARPHFWILADETRRKIPTTNGLHHSRKRTISMGHFTNGTTGLPSLFSTINGRSASKPPKCVRLHWRSAHPLPHPWMTPPNTGAGAWQTKTEPLKNKPGKMHLWEQRSFIPGIFLNAGRNQARQEPTEGHRDRSSTHRCQINQILRRIMHLLPDTHQGFGDHRSALIQTNKERFWIQRRTSTRRRHESFCLTPETTHIWASHGLSTPGSPEYALITDAATGTADTPGGLRPILTQVNKNGRFYAISFASRQLKNHKKNYSPFLLEAAAAVWGMDHFNEYLKGKKFIL